MKKAYIKPSTIEVKVKAQSLMTGSPKLEFKPTETTEAMESRRHSFSVWGDEETEEEE